MDPIALYPFKAILTSALADLHRLHSSDTQVFFVFHVVATIISKTRAIEVVYDSTEADKERHKLLVRRRETKCGRFRSSEGAKILAEAATRK